MAPFIRLAARSSASASAYSPGGVGGLAARPRARRRAGRRGPGRRGCARRRSWGPSSISMPAAARWRATAGRQLLGQALQLGRDRAVQLLAGDLLGDRRAVVACLAPRCAARCVVRRGRLPVVLAAGGRHRACRRDRPSALSDRPGRPACRRAGRRSLVAAIGGAAAAAARLSRGDGRRPSATASLPWTGPARRSMRVSLEKRKGHPSRGGLYERMSGDVLLSHNLPVAVPSALKGLTSGFGMEPGVSLSLWSPKLYGVSANQPEVS